MTGGHMADGDEPGWRERECNCVPRCPSEHCTGCCPCCRKAGRKQNAALTEDEKDIAARLRALADDLPAKPVHLGLLQQALCGGAAEIEQLRAKLQEHITGGPRNYMHKQMHAQLMEEKDAEIARLKANTPETCEDFAMIGGKRYPVKFEGYDRHTYSHRVGCLAYNFGSGPCQCGAAERAGRVFGVHIPPRDSQKALEQRGESRAEFERDRGFISRCLECGGEKTGGLTQHKSNCSQVTSLGKEVGQ